MKVYDNIDGIMSFSRGTLMARFGVEIVPLHPDNWFLLGMQWRDKYFIYMALPLGLRSAPYIFSSVYIFSTPWVHPTLRLTNTI